MPEDNISYEKRKMKYEISYSEMTLVAAEKRLDLDFQTFVSEATSVDCMLAEAKRVGGGKEEDAIINQTKEKVWHHIIEYLNFEGYPTAACPDFKSANINDFILYIIGPILWAFNIELEESSVVLRREKEIISPDSKTGGYGEFVVVEEPWCGETFILIIESKPCLGDAIKQCLLAMKDMWSSNARGKVYGFITTGEDWRMASYDGSIFKITDKFTVLFAGGSSDQVSVLVDCIMAALLTGGVK